MFIPGAERYSLLTWFALADAWSAWGSACSVAGDCSSIVSPDFEGHFSTSTAAGSPWLLSDGLPTAAHQTVMVSGCACRSVFALPRRSGGSLRRLLEMEHAAAVVPLFDSITRCMVAGFGAAATASTAAPSVSPSTSLLSHGGAQVATTSRTGYTPAPCSPRSCTQDRVSASDDLSSLDSKQWDKASWSVPPSSRHAPAILT